MKGLNVNKEAPTPNKSVGQTKHLNTTARETPAHNSATNSTEQYTTSGGKGKAKKGARGHAH